jgi:adenylate cyclase
VLAEFPSAVDAVQCAVEVQAALMSIGEERPGQAHLQFRIGVHVGDVMLRGSDLLGDGVNIAARLENIAEPGGVCISASATSMFVKLCRSPTLILVRSRSRTWKSQFARIVS